MVILVLPTEYCIHGKEGGQGEHMSFESLLSSILLLVRYTATLYSTMHTNTLYSYSICLASVQYNYTAFKGWKPQLKQFP